MWYLREWEQECGSAIKSVLIVVLSLLLLVQQGRSASTDMETAGGLRALPADQGAEEDTMMVRDNPIDRCYGGLLAEIEKGISEGKASAGQVMILNLYLDSWEQELEHAYYLWRSRLTGGYYGSGYLEEAESAFVVYAQAQGWLEAYCLQEGASAGSREKSTVSGDTLSAEQTKARAELVRSQALRMYGLLEQCAEGDVTWENLFLFDGERLGSPKDSGNRRY